MILSASRRTDIPCYYIEWFMNRLKAGYVLSRNPMNHAQISKIRLSPDAVDCIVFWTKDAKNSIPHLKAIDDMGYKFYFQHTLTPYDRTIERNLRDKSDIENSFIELSNAIGKERVLWRYDPIVLNSSLSMDYHKEQFTRLCDKLYPYTESVTISFVDTYAKLKTDSVRQITNDEIANLSEFIGKTAKEYGLIAKACSELNDLTILGIEKASCIDKALIEQICGARLNLSPDYNQREGCRCYQSIDIGAYNTCKNGCVYCYANYSESSVNRNCEKHKQDGEMLIGKLQNGEKIVERNLKSNIVNLDIK